MLKKDIQESIELYQACYGNTIDPSTVFTALRHMVRTAIYQSHFDKEMLTGSDHGILHAHHNCKHSEAMHEAIDKTDPVTSFQRLLVKFIHYYHDIGYSVGGQDFTVKKDHPFISAAFIDANREFFKKCLPVPQNADIKSKKEPVDIIKNVILNHANISFDSDPNDLEKMTMFTVTNSDACAISMDEKSQAIWRQNPELLIELTRIQKFIEIYPEYGGFKGLGSDNIAAKPESVFTLKKDVLDKISTDDTEDYREAINKAMEGKENYEKPGDHLAYTIYKKCVDNMMRILSEKSDVMFTTKEIAQFHRAISNSLTAIGGSVAIAQSSASVDSVSCEKVKDTHEVTEPKYQPIIGLDISRVSNLITSLLGQKQGVKNTKKLMDEYAAGDLLNEENISSEHNFMVVDGPVSRFNISYNSENATKAIRQSEKNLENIAKDFIPEKIRSLKDNFYQKIKKQIRDKNIVPQELTEDLSAIEQEIKSDQNKNIIWKDKESLLGNITKLQNGIKSNMNIENLLNVFYHSLITDGEYNFIFNELEIS